MLLYYSLVHKLIYCFNIEKQESILLLMKFKTRFCLKYVYFQSIGIYNVILAHLFLLRL